MTDPITAAIRGYLAAAEPMWSDRYLDSMAGGISAALRPLIPDAPQPAVTDDAVERAAIVPCNLAAPVARPCDACGAPSTHTTTPGGFRFCDNHGAQR